MGGAEGRENILCPTQASHAPAGKENMSDIDLLQEELLRSYYSFLSKKDVFNQMQKAFFPFKGITHADIMFESIRRLGQPSRYHMIDSLDRLMTKGTVASFHLGPEYRDDILTCHRSVGRVFHPHSRMFCLDIDVDRLDPSYHLIAIDFLVRSFRKSFGGVRNDFNVLVCTSGNGWHVYIDTLDHMKLWDSERRRAAWNWIQMQDFLEPVRGDYMRLKPGYRWKEDGTLLKGGYGVLFSDQFKEWYELHCIKRKVAFKEKAQERLIRPYGFVMSALYQLSKFITSTTDKHNQQINKLLHCKTVASIFNWLDGFKVFADSLAQSKECPNPFQDPESCKALVFYLCVQETMKETGFVVDRGMQDMKHPLRAPFSAKFKDLGKENNPDGFRYDAYLCVPLGTISNALRSKGCKVRLLDLKEFNVSGDEKDLPPLLKEGLRAWNRFFMFRGIESRQEDLF